MSPSHGARIKLDSWQDARLRMMVSTVSMVSRETVAVLALRAYPAAQSKCTAARPPPASKWERCVACGDRTVSTNAAQAHVNIGI